MALRKVVRIDEELCDGCGECVPSCAEGAIRVIDGKARLMADNLCDGLGACLGDCPQGALTVEERDADEFDEDAVESHLASLRGDEPVAKPSPMESLKAQSGGCPGSRMITFDTPADAAAENAGSVSSELRQWPVQLHLVPPMAPYFKGADLLLAADCTAFAVGDFHSKFLKSKSLAVACPKLDQNQEIYLQKLVSMIDDAQINTITVLIMQVPCCTGLAILATEAASRASRKVPVKRVVVDMKGHVLDEAWC